MGLFKDEERIFFIVNDPYLNKKFTSSGLVMDKFLVDYKDVIDSEIEEQFRVFSNGLIEKESKRETGIKAEGKRIKWMK